jgi:hypothetical protein
MVYRNLYTTLYKCVGQNNADTHALAIFALHVGCKTSANYTSQRRSDGDAGNSKCKRGNDKSAVSAVRLAIFI